MIYEYFKSRLNRNRRSPAADASQLDLMIEKLEDRQMLSVSVDIVDRVLTIQGDGADDTILLSENHKTIWVYADSMAESIVYDKAESRIRSVVVNGGGGDDTIVANRMFKAVTINGNAGNDRIFGGLNADTLDGGDGNDIIYGNSGLDIIFGRNGDDTLVGGLGNDTIEGGADNDFIVGGNGDDDLSGDAGDDFVLGSGGQDTIRGGIGNDRLAGNNGNDLIEGGRGNDILTGDGNDDVLFGEEGDDRVIGGSGNDLAQGGAGDDVIVGGLGDDQLEGEDGDDIVLGDGGNDTIEGGLGADSLFGGSGDDVMLGGGGDDRMFGGLGNDLLSGHGGEDLLIAGEGRDVLIGGYFKDILNGGSGEDYLISGVINIDSSALEHSDPLFLSVVRDAWAEGDSFEERISATDQTVDVGFEAAADVLVGSDGRDVFYSGANTIVADEQAGERIFDDRFRSVDDTFNIAINETLTFNAEDGVFANDINPRGGALTAVLIADAQHGELIFNADGSFTYTQSTRGADNFVYEVTNRFGETDRALVTLTSGIPDLPSAALLTELDSGLEVYDFEVGTGATPELTDTVTVNYVGYLPDGTIFDSNDDIDFGLDGVIDGFAEGIAGMQVGGRRRIVIPPDLGYGEDGNPRAGIDGDDVITFDVDLLGIVEP